MAFEVHYYYHPRGDDGGYNTSETKTFVKRYGKGYEEHPLGGLAASIITQLSRRDLWITDVKVFEFVRKEIRFKETKGGGIVLGHKKFSLDSGNALVEVSEEVEKPAITTNQTRVQSQSKPPLRYEVFNPQPELLQYVKGLNLTIGNRYPIFEEKFADSNNIHAGMNYLINDNAGRNIWARSVYFEAIQQNALLYANESVAMKPDAIMKSNFVDSVKSYAEPGVDMSVPDLSRLRGR